MKVEYKALRVERKTLSKMSGRRHITLSRLGKYYIILVKSNYNIKIPSPGCKSQQTFCNYIRHTYKESFLNANSITLFRNKRFLVNLILQRYDSNFALFMENENPHSFFLDTKIALSQNFCTYFRQLLTQCICSAQMKGGGIPIFKQP